MTAPREPAPAREWWTRPSVMLPLVATVALLVALLSPQAPSGRFGDPRLSTHLAGSLGARLFADAAERMGWRVVRKDSVPAPLASDGRTIHAILAPPMPQSREEAHRYLEAVRGGDAMLLVLEGRSPLSDSLHVTSFARGGILPRSEALGGECPEQREMTPPLWADGKVRLLGVRWLRGAPPNRDVFARVDADESGPSIAADAAIGFPYGKGRIVVVGDPDLLRNDVLRYCPWGAHLIASRMLEWLRAGGDAPRTTLVFDEYHHGFGPRRGVLTVVAAFLGAHPLGRTILQVVLAGVVLLFAVAPRPIRPSVVQRFERRDPLEQVDALAHAYEQVHATRTITARLLRGVRRRVERGRSAARARPDEAFLDAIVNRAPPLAEDVAIVRNALQQQLTDRDFLAVGGALQRIEDTLTTTPT